MSDFDSLGVAPTLIKALSRTGIEHPTPIQQQGIPLALAGHDILGLAQTGTGKTLAFGLPMIDRLLAMPGRPAPKSVKALILAPTRELVNQIAESLRPLVHNTPVRVTTVVGGQSIHRQIQTLARGIDILVATPGRLIDLMERGSVLLSTVQFLVLDEADQMLDLGFIHALRQIAPRLGTPRQTMMFSATMPKQLEELTRSYLTSPRRVEVAPPGKTADKVEQIVMFVEKSEKPARLREILSRDLDALTLVFGRTKHGAEKLMKQLVADGYNAASIHGNKSQGQRDRAIKAFRDGTVTVLVATDVAARGIDIPGVAYVINYELPNVPEAYVHRIGRTARAGRGGTAISFCSTEELDLLRDIEKMVGRGFGAPAAPSAAPARRKSRPARADDTQTPAGKPKRRRNRRGKGPKPGAPEGARKTGKDTSRTGQARMPGKAGPRRSNSAA